MALPFWVLSVLLLFVPHPATAKKIDGERLFEPAHLVEIDIRLDSADWDMIRFQARDIGSVFSGGNMDDPFTYVKADLNIDGIEIKSVGLRKKGLIGSTDSERPSLKIKFDEFEKQDPVKGLSRLTLNNNKQDTSQLSQYLTYFLFRKAGIHAPRSNFARVTVNGQYLGIYSNVESIDKPFLKKSFGDNDGNLYEGTLTDFHPKTIGKLEVKTNEVDNDLSQLGKLTEILAAEGPLDVARLSEIIDLDNFMRFWSMEGILRFWDGYASNQNNFYVYFNPANRRAYFMPWGADGSFTKDGGPFGMFWGGDGTTSFYAQSILCNRLYHAKGIPERYRATTLALLDEVWSEAELLAEMDRMEKLITPHLHPSQQATANALNDVRDFIRGRRDVVQKELAGGPFRIQDMPRKPMYQVVVGHLSGSFNTTWQAQPPNGTPNASEADIKLQLHGKDVGLEDMTVTVTEFRMPQFGPPGGGPGFGGPPGGAIGGGGPQGNGNLPQTPPMIIITIAGKQTVDQQPISMSVMMDRGRFDNAVTQKVVVNGRLTEGQPAGFAFGPPQGKSLTGTFSLTKAAAAPGDEFAGGIEMQVVEAHGGFFDNPPGGFGGPPGPGGPGRPGGFGPPPGRDAPPGSRPQQRPVAAEK